MSILRYLLHEEKNYVTNRAISYVCIRQNGYEITWNAAVVDLDVEKHDAREAPFRICDDLDRFSWLINYLTEREVQANHFLKSQAKQHNRSLSDNQAYNRKIASRVACSLGHRK